MKRTLISILALTLLAILLAGCDLNQIVTVDTPVPGKPVPTSPAGPTAAPGETTGGGGIVVPGVRLNVYAPSPNPEMNKPGVGGHVAGILLGLWHGVISPVTLIVSFFNKNVQMYEVHNDGSMYNLGFFVGLAVLVFGLGFLRR